MLLSEHKEKRRRAMVEMNLDYMDKDFMLKAIQEAADFIKGKISKQPMIAMILGSGLGAFADELKEPVVISFEEVPYFPRPTVEGHGGKLFIGELEGKCVLVMQGRFHYYEGYDTQTLTFPVRVFAKLGIENIVLTNACGGVNKHFKAGQLMIIEDHISNFCPSPLRGAHLDEFGPRFTDMSQAYDKEFIQMAEQCAEELDIKVQKGVYAFWHGPSYETPAEIRAYMALGADVVGMSTVGETAVAVNCGMRVLGISCITNMTSVISKGKTSHEEVIEVGRRVAASFISLLTAFVKKL